MASPHKQCLQVVGIILIFHAIQCNGKLFVLKRPETSANCIMVDADFSIQLKVDGSEETRIMDSNSTNIDRISGSCGDTATMNIDFNNTVSWSLIFTVESREVTIDRLVQFKPEKVFQDKKFGPNWVTFDDPGTSKTSPVDKSYECSKLEETAYDRSTVVSNYNFTVTVIVYRIHSQAFNIVNNTFSPAFECQNENTTTTSTTSTTPTTPTTSTNSTTKPTTVTTTPTPLTTPAPAPLNNYTVTSNVNNFTCISLMGRISFDITYDVKKESENDVGKATRTFSIPAVYKHTGQCRRRGGTEHLRIQFFDNWSFTFVFQENGKEGNKIKAGEQKDIDYKIANITLVYVMHPNRFPNATTPNKRVQAFKNVDLPHKAAGHDFYRCDVQTHENLASDPDITNVVTFTARDLQFKAFNTNNDTTFVGSPSECAADDDSAHLIPIIIGSVLAGFVLIIIIVYLVFRYRRFQDYNKV